MVVRSATIPDDPASVPRASARRPGGHASRRYLLSLAFVALVTLVGHLLFAASSITNVALLYLLPVSVAATRYGLRTGIFTSIASSLAYNFFFLPPTHTLAINDPDNILTAFVLLVVAVVSSKLAARLHDQAQIARRSAAQSRSLVGFARQLTAVITVDELAHLLCGEVRRLLDVHTVLLLSEGDGLVQRAALPPGARLDSMEQAAARWALEQRRPAGRGSDTLSASEWLFHPLTSADRSLAVFGMARADAGMPLHPDQEPLLHSLLDQAALALERIALEAEIVSVNQLKERDRLRAALLSSVSHDLRTPLTTMSAVLADIRPASEDQARQLKEARGEAERLGRFVANLLDMVRIETGALHQSIEPVDLMEAVAAAIHDLRRVLRGQKVRIELPADLPFVRVDPQLFHHILINLIENAAKYGDTDTAIAVSARYADGLLTLSVLDAGPGLPAGEEERIFDMFTRIEGSDRRGGTGLGLAIVKGFAEAMGIEVRAGNRADGPGARFDLLFPADSLVESHGDEE